MRKLEPDSESARRFLKKTQPVLTKLPLFVTRPLQNCFGYMRVKWNEFEVIEYKNRNFNAAYVCSALRGVNDTVIMYLHGGAYTSGGYGYVRNQSGYFCTQLSVPVFGLSYDLAPEYRFPRPIINALAAYDFLLTKYPSEKIFLLGESAGGGLAFSLCMQLRELKRPMPRGIINMSPWTDLSLSQKTYTSNIPFDVTLSVPALAESARAYAGDDLKNPLVSPIYGDVRGLPETVFFVSSSELLLDDSRVMYERLIASGVPATLHVFPGLWHVFPVFDVPETEKALELMREFIRR